MIDIDMTHTVYPSEPHRNSDGQISCKTYVFTIHHIHIAVYIAVSDNTRNSYSKSDTDHILYLCKS